MKDVEAVDIQSLTFLNEMEKNIAQIKSYNSGKDSESFFTSATDESRFDIVSSSGQTYERIPGVSDIPITMAHVDRQISCIREGCTASFPIII